MSELMKIRDVSLDYHVSVRTLRYYEEMGLLHSIRTDEYAYRVYDQENLKRLSQILMLRHMNISIKDIKTVFEVNDCQKLIEILDQKVTDIDQDVAQLSELRRIVTEFIHQVKTLSISNTTETQQLLDKVSEFEAKVARSSEEDRGDESHSEVENNSEQSSDDKSLNNTNQNSHEYIMIPDVRILELPACKMVSSGAGFFGEEEFDRFDRWFSKMIQADFIMPQDFLWYDPMINKMTWWYCYQEGMDTEGFAIEEFEGGLYAVAVSKDNDDEDGNRVYQGIKDWVKKSGSLELDERPNHYTMSHIITSKTAQAVLGYSQLEILVPVKKLQEEEE